MSPRPARPSPPPGVQARRFVRRAAPVDPVALESVSRYVCRAHLNPVSIRGRGCDLCRDERLSAAARRRARRHRKKRIERNVDWSAV